MEAFIYYHYYAHEVFVFEQDLWIVYGNVQQLYVTRPSACGVV